MKVITLIITVQMYECQTCPRTFKCETCPRVFKSQNAADQHMNALRHWRPKVPCETCGKMFHTQNAADQHMRALGHYKNYCDDCHLAFQNENNLRMHLRSKIHHGINIPCPYCSAKYTSASGVAHHLEMGCCPCAPEFITVKPSTAPFVSVTHMESLPTRRLNGMRREMSHTWLPTVHSMAYSGSVTYATKSSTPRVP
ncbi:hypothetical protein VTN96DRAFT_7288 [Rasamsonia emersonii]